MTKSPQEKKETHGEAMIKWEVVFRELDEALQKVTAKYKDKSQMNIIVFFSNKKSEHWKVPFKEIKEKVWKLSSEYKYAVALSIRTIRNTIIYEVVRYPLMNGQGAGARGDSTTIELFNSLSDDDRDLVVRLIHSQIQDRFAMEAAYEQPEE